MHSFTEMAWTELYVQQRKLLKMFNVLEIDSVNFIFNFVQNIAIRIVSWTQYRDTYQIVSCVCRYTPNLHPNTVLYKYATYKVLSRVGGYPIAPRLPWASQSIFLKYII